MLKKELVLRVSSIALLALLFVSAKAMADKSDEQEQSSSIFVNISLADEANLINNGALNASQLTTIGDRVDQR